MASTKTDPVRDDRFVRLYHDEGLTIAAIAQQERVSHTTVHRALRRQERPSRHKGSHGLQLGESATANGCFDYSPEEQEFLRACLLYQQRKGKPLRACDYLAVLKGMGYRRE